MACAQLGRLYTPHFQTPDLSRELNGPFNCTTTVPYTLLSQSSTKTMNHESLLSHAMYH